MAKKKVHRFGEVCRLLDVQPYVLRYWETEFPVLAGEGADGGQRTYTDQDLAVVQRIKELLYNESFTLVGAKKKLQVELDKGKLKLSEPADAGPVEAGSDETDEEEAATAEKAKESSPAKETKRKTKGKAVARKKTAARKAEDDDSSSEAGAAVDVAELKAILSDAQELLEELRG